MTAVADAVLKLFSEFARAQWTVDELARSCTGVDDTVRAALERAGRWNPDQVIRRWQNRNQSFLHDARSQWWFNELNTHAQVLSTRLNDQSRPFFFELFSTRELGATGLHAHYVETYQQVKRLRDFLAHNMSMKALSEERLAVGWFHDSSIGRWMEEDESRLDLAFLLRAVEVAEWLLDVATWTTWKLGFNGNAVIEDSKGMIYSDEHRPPVSPPHNLTVPVAEGED